jgi:hypothetical protein
MRPNAPKPGVPLGHLFYFNEKIMSEIKCFRTITGEDIIAEIVDTKYGEYYFVKNPATINLTDTESSIRVGLTPYLPFADGAIKFYIHSLSAEANLDPKMVEEYKKVFSPIITPSSKIII